MSTANTGTAIGVKVPSQGKFPGQVAAPAGTTTFPATLSSTGTDVTVVYTNTSSWTQANTTAKLFDTEADADTFQAAHSANPVAYPA